MSWRYYRDRVGDYLAVRNPAIARGVYDAVAPEKEGNPASVDFTVVDAAYLKTCRAVDADKVPAIWRAFLQSELLERT